MALAITQEKHRDAPKPRTDCRTKARGAHQQLFSSGRKQLSFLQAEWQQWESHHETQSLCITFTIPSQNTPRLPLIYDFYWPAFTQPSRVFGFTAGSMAWSSHRTSSQEINFTWRHASQRAQQMWGSLDLLGCAWLLTCPRNHQTVRKSAFKRKSRQTSSLVRSSSDTFSRFLSSKTFMIIQYFSS